MGDFHRVPREACMNGANPTPSPGTPGEGRGEGAFQFECEDASVAQGTETGRAAPNRMADDSPSRSDRTGTVRLSPLPQRRLSTLERHPHPEYRERGQDALRLDSPTRVRAALVSLLLCLLFFAVYGTTNYLTSLRHDVGSWVYPWEHYIPFIPLMIVPYMSIDLFFVAAPFVCTDRRELRLLALRVCAAILICGAFFLAMPLRFTFERPPVHGILGVVFNHFRQMDKPYNQFPSLHIVLRTILADLYARHAPRRWLRVLSDVWFSLIGASTLLVYQHHVVDVVGGFALAAVIFYVLSDTPCRSPVSRNHRVGAVYFIAGILSAV